LNIADHRSVFPPAIRTPKPDAAPHPRAQGRGIFLFNEIKDVKEWKKANDARNSTSKKDKEDEEVEVYVAQRYIDNPYLVTPNPKPQTPKP
jgi:hypothetical protein